MDKKESGIFLYVVFKLCLSTDTCFYSEITCTNSVLQQTSKLIVHIITRVGYLQVL